MFWPLVFFGQDKVGRGVQGRGEQEGGENGEEWFIADFVWTGWWRLPESHRLGWAESGLGFQVAEGSMRQKMPPALRGRSGVFRAQAAFGRPAASGIPPAWAARCSCMSGFRAWVALLAE